jgi:preprotein translocase subunit SecA
MSDAAVAELRPGFSWGAYPERVDAGPGWLEDKGPRVADALLRRLAIRRNRLIAFAERVGSYGPRIERMGAADVLEEAAVVGALLRREGLRDEPIARAFALVREVARRETGKFHFPTQLMGGRVLLGGAITEMETGEGKTLTAVLPASAAALAGIPVHVITVNDYLVERDAEEMGPVYRALGLRVGAVIHGMQPAERRAAYAADVTYVSNKEIAFDYLKDRIALGRHRSRVRLQLERVARGGSREDRLLLRGLCFAIVDEADSVLVDEARTPLIISGGQRHDELEERVYEVALEVAGRLEAGRDFIVDLRERRVVLTNEGEKNVAALTDGQGGLWSGPNRRAELVALAVSALHLHVRDRHYLVRDDKVHIIDEHTGRLMSDRSWQRGLHQMIEAKEDVPITGVTEPLAKISYQRFFRRYVRLGGMTGTAREVSRELWTVYGLPVIRIPTNRPLRRESHGVQVHASADAKWRAVVERIRALHAEQRPVLVGTRSVAASERLSALLEADGLPHLVLNARQDKEEAEVVARAGIAGAITVATNMAGRGTDIRLDPAVAAAGGLHVVATELHESRRIDRQLFGRCARQGDQGSYECIISLEDEIVHEHGTFGRWLSWLEDGATEDDAVGSRWRGLAVRLAQRRAERLHAEMRREVLNMDDRVATMLAFSGQGE